MTAVDGVPWRCTRHRSAPVAGSTAIRPLSPAPATTSSPSAANANDRTGAGTSTRHCSAPVSAARPTSALAVRATTMSVVASSPGVPSRQSTGVVHSVAPVTMSAAPTWPVGQAIEKTRPSAAAPAATSGPRLIRQRSSPVATSNASAVGPSTADGVAGFPGSGSAGTVVGAEEPVTGVVVPGSLVGADASPAPPHDTTTNAATAAAAATAPGPPHATDHARPTGTRPQGCPWPAFESRLVSGYCNQA